jgi:hypothetical protein
MDEKRLAIASCSCPRPAGHELVAPLCAVEEYVTGQTIKGYGLLFVKPPAGLLCKQLNSFGYGHFCTCKNRLQVYLKYRL